MPDSWQSVHGESRSRPRGLRDTSVRHLSELKSRRAAFGHFTQYYGMGESTTRVARYYGKGDPSQGSTPGWGKWPLRKVKWPLVKGYMAAHKRVHGRS